jgi:hypothetical protein
MQGKLNKILLIEIKSQKHQIKTINRHVGKPFMAEKGEKRVILHKTI